MATKCPKCDFANTADSKFCKECGTHLFPSEGPQVAKTLTLETKPEGLTRGTVFAGRYEILEELGGGGMGKVYRVYDRKLEEEVALKLIRPEIAAGRKAIERFRNEIKISRKITHKNVCRMHDLGEAEGTSFITMEYVRGEDLKSLLHRTKTLPVGTALSIAHQVAYGLSEAHRLGIIHRDLKPGNIMIDKDGDAKIMDFGIARSLLGKGLTGEGAIIGTPEYMSPEQVDGKEVDARSDIYSLGIILYEMLTGRAPFEGDTPFSVALKNREETPKDPREANVQVTPDLSRLILRCLEKDKKKRYQSSDELRIELEDFQQRLRNETAAQLPAAAVPAVRARLRARRAVALWVAPLLLALGIAAWIVMDGDVLRPALWFSGRPALTLGERDTVLLGEIENSTDDPALEGSLKAALEISLEQSPRVRLLTPDRVRQALLRMRRGEDEKLTQDLAREVCQREGSRALIVGSVTRVADKYILTVRIIDPSTGATIRTLTERANSRDQILPGLDKLATSVRRLLGETLASIATANRKLAEATTRSLEALKNYSEGSVLLERGRRDDARSVLTRAVELDPEFALAHAALANTYRSYAFHLDDAKAEHHFQEALKRLDRVSERERMEIQGLYNGVMGRYEDAADFHRQLVGRYPNDPAYHSDLAADYRALNRPRDAIAEAEKALQLSPSSPGSMVALAIMQGDVREWSQMVRYYEQAFAIEPELTTDTIHNHQYGWALVQINRPDAARAAFRKMLELEPVKKARGHRSLGILALYQGKLSEARRELEEARRLDETSGTFNSAARDLYYLAEGLALLGGTGDAISQLTKAVDLSRKASWTVLSLRLSTLLARSGRCAEASRIVESNRKQAQAGDSYERSDLMRADGEIALARGKTAEALELLRQAEIVQPWILTQISLARALDRAGQNEEAIAAYEKVITRGPEPWEGNVEWAISHIALAHLYEHEGRREEARRTCGQLREVWKDADEDLPPVRELTATLARVRVSRQPTAELPK